MTGPPPADPWDSGAFLRAWNDYLAASQALAARLGGAPADAAGGQPPNPFWGAWQEFAQAALGAFPSRAAQSSGLEGALRGLAPALGCTREYQLIVERMRESSAQMQRCWTELAAQTAHIGETALRSLVERGKSDPSLAAAPTAAYAAWIDAAEQAYADTAHGESFAKSLGGLCNAFGAFRLERGRLLESIARHLDLPSRAEVDSLNRRLDQLAERMGHVAAAAPSTAAPSTAAPSTAARRKRNPRKRIPRKPRAPR